MGLGVKATPFTYAAHALAAVAAVLVLVWCVHFRGGLALEAQNKNLIFNVSTGPPRSLPFRLQLASAFGIWLSFVPSVVVPCLLVASHVSARCGFSCKEEYRTVAYVRFLAVVRDTVPRIWDFSWKSSAF